MAVSFVIFKGDATCCSSGECGHGLSRFISGKLLTFFILLVPIVVAARYDSRAGYTGTMVRNRGTISEPPVKKKPVADYLVHTPDGRIVAEVLDLLYAAQDNLLREDFEGQQVELVGQFMPDSSNNASGNRFKAVRMFMTCCAADAQPVATLVEADKLPTFPEMTWVKITGTPTFPIEKGRRISVLKAETVEKVDPPVEAMIY
jgi:uncharacterized repeat protein (TIGR03943 family)